MGEQFAYRHALVAKTCRHGKRGFRREHLLGTPPAAVRRREKKYAGRHSPDLISATLSRSRGQHREADEKQHQRREREIPRGRVKLRLGERAERDSFEQHEQHALERPFARTGDRAEHDELQDERGSGDDGHAAEHGNTIRMRDERVDEQNEQEHVEQQKRQPRFGRDEIEDLRRGKER